MLFITGTKKQTRMKTGDRSGCCCDGPDHAVFRGRVVEAFGTVGQKSRQVVGGEWAVLR